MDGQTTKDRGRVTSFNSKESGVKQMRFHSRRQVLMIMMVLIESSISIRKMEAALEKETRAQGGGKGHRGATCSLSLPVSVCRTIC